MRLVDSVRDGRIRLCGLGAHRRGDPIRVASELTTEDGLLDDTDALIAASALSCEDCEVLFTNDPRLLGCRPLLKMARAKPLAVREAPKR